MFIANYQILLFTFFECYKQINFFKHYVVECWLLLDKRK